jgi:cation diffusion facilitator CzcD-associated flavoprotein CzcO
MNLALAAPRRVAIVGGGLSGLACANALQNVMDVSVWDMGKSGPGIPLWPTVPVGLVIDSILTSSLSPALPYVLLSQGLRK